MDTHTPHDSTSAFPHFLFVPLSLPFKCAIDTWCTWKSDSEFRQKRTYKEDNLNSEKLKNSLQPQLPAGGIANAIDVGGARV
jgi:hypothetical protein